MIRNFSIFYHYAQWGMGLRIPPPPGQTPSTPRCHGRESNPPPPGPTSKGLSHYPGAICSDSLRSSARSHCTSGSAVAAGGPRSDHHPTSPPSQRGVAVGKLHTTRPVPVGSGVTVITTVASGLPLSPPVVTMVAEAMTALLLTSCTSTAPDSILPPTGPAAPMSEKFPS